MPTSYRLIEFAMSLEEGRANAQVVYDKLADETLWVKSPLAKAFWLGSETLPPE